MAEVILDTSVLIGLCFRHAGERAACNAVIPTEATRTCSRYALFELARGFLRNLIQLHNDSFEFDSFSDLHQAAHSGAMRFKQYRMQTWLGAFDDYFAELDSADGSMAGNLKLEEFRAKLRGWIRRGWQKLHKDFAIRNDAGCRVLSPPKVRNDKLIDHELPTDECGTPSACGVQQFVTSRRAAFGAVKEALGELVDPDSETKKRIEALEHLLTTSPGLTFKGRKCHECGDALVCLDAPNGAAVATKNKKHFAPIIAVLQQELIVARTASSTSAEH